jgi:hypothetical protein
MDELEEHPYTERYRCADQIVTRQAWPRQTDVPDVSGPGKRERRPAARTAEVLYASRIVQQRGVVDAAGGTLARRGRINHVTAEAAIGGARFTSRGPDILRPQQFCAAIGTRYRPKQGLLHIAFWPFVSVAGTAICGCAVSHILAAADSVLSYRGEQEQERGLAMKVAWILLGLAMVGAYATRLTWFHERRPPDLGFVSDQWLAEHRQITHSSDPQR